MNTSKPRAVRAKKFTSLIITTLSITTLSFASIANASNQCIPAFDSRIQTEVESLLNRKTELYHSLTGHMPKAIKAMTDQGKMSEAEVLPVTIALELNNEDELNQRIEEMYRPGSPTYHQFITSQEFVAKYAPTAQQIQDEKSLLESQGIAVEDVTENHLFLHASGTVAALNTAFKTEIHNFVHSNGQQYFAPAYDLQAPVSSRIAAVVGLNNTAVAHGHLHKTNASPRASLNTKSEGSAPGPYGGLAPSDIHMAYNIPTNLDGSGQTLALVELDGYNAANIAVYESAFGLPATPLRNVLVGGFNGRPTTGRSSGEAEVELDIEMMVAIAPRATQIIVYEGANTGRTAQQAGQDFINVYSKIASDNVAKVISSSWGMAEGTVDRGTLQSENKVFQQMVAQGQSFFVAAGDNGAFDNGTSVVGTDDPASQPFVTAVGGTKLIINSNAQWASETTWNELSLVTNGKATPAGAGGGGVSKDWTIPSWQASVIGADSQASRSMRNVPDVSLNSDPETGYGIYVTDPSSGSTKPQWIPMGGTSAAAPLWAAFNALVNQYRAAKGLSPTGFLNPRLYAIGASSRYTADFHDINDGSNNGTAKGNFRTFKGYDNATGWGSFNGINLMTDLSAN